MSEKFTTGPWRIASKNFKTAFYVIHGRDLTSTPEREVQVIKMDYGTHPIKEHLENMYANAKLIASAPELLEALTESRLFVEQTIIETGFMVKVKKELLSKIDAAISKAIK